VTRVIAVLALAGFCWLSFSVGQALTAPDGGSVSARLSEWARDHYLGPVVTFGEWLTYQPPKVGGAPPFSLAPPAKKPVLAHRKGFTADVPRSVAPFASPPLPGEGVWRLVEGVHGEPAEYVTFLRVDSVHTSYVAGIASFDQRLVRFQLHPGSQDPGSGFGGGAPWIPPGQRAGLLATFNGGFRLNASGGGFYLNGSASGRLVDGAASEVYYRDGRIAVGQWGRDMRMTPEVVGVRQNLKLIVDRGRVPAAVDQNVESSWGATLGGSYDVWRSGVGVTADGRVIYAYGPALSVRQLAVLLQRAGAVEGMQLDINLRWATFQYFPNRDGNPATSKLYDDFLRPSNRFFDSSTKDFMAVYLR